MIRAAKKLKKLWPKRKRIKRPFPDSFYYIPPPPPLTPPPSCQHCCCHSHSNSPIQPSAPPLPPWLETIEHKFTRNESEPEEIAEEADNYPALLSYQQYTVTAPVYGVPFVGQPQQSPTRETRAAFFGHFIRCFCPCFYIRQIE
ncbi:hypothetical protein M5689_001025 [Euphorbia peplus]|nr:hypothetical protein M5689_001025 [Euphorbia peplus]